MGEPDHCLPTDPISRDTDRWLGKEKKYCVKSLVNSRNILTMRKLAVGQGKRKRREKKHWGLLRSSSCGWDRGMWPFQPAALEKQQFTVELTQSRTYSCHPTKQEKFDLIQTAWNKIFWSWIPIKMHMNKTNIFLNCIFYVGISSVVAAKLNNTVLVQDCFSPCHLLLCVSSPGVLVLHPNV